MPKMISRCAAYALCALFGLAALPGFAQVSNPGFDQSSKLPNWYRNNFGKQGFTLCFSQPPIARNAGGISWIAPHDDCYGDIDDSGPRQFELWENQMTQAAIANQLVKLNSGIAALNANLTTQVATPIGDLATEIAAQNTRANENLRNEVLARLRMVPVLLANEPTLQESLLEALGGDAELARKVNDAFLTSPEAKALIKDILAELIEENEEN